MEVRQQLACIRIPAIVPHPKVSTFSKYAFDSSIGPDGFSDFPQLPTMKISLKSPEKKGTYPCLTSFVLQNSSSSAKKSLPCSNLAMNVLPCFNSDDINR